MIGSSNAQKVQKIDSPSTVILGPSYDYAIEANTATNLRLDGTLYSHGDVIVERVSDTSVKVLKAGYYLIHSSVYAGQWNGLESQYGTAIITSKRTSAMQVTAPNTSVTNIRNLQTALDVYLDVNDTIDFGFIAEAKVTITADKTGLYWGKTGTHLQITYLGGGELRKFRAHSFVRRCAHEGIHKLASTGRQHDDDRHPADSKRAQGPDCWTIQWQSVNLPLFQSEFGRAGVRNTCKHRYTSQFISDILHDDGFDCKYHLTQNREWTGHLHDTTQYLTATPTGVTA